MVNFSVLEKLFREEQETYYQKASYFMGNKSEEF